MEKQNVVVRLTAEQKTELRPRAKGDCELLWQGVRHIGQLASASSKVCGALDSMQVHWKRAQQPARFNRESSQSVQISSIVVCLHSTGPDAHPVRQADRVGHRPGF